MKLPFDTTEFFRIFGLYNMAVWPLQVLMYVLTLVALFLLWKRRPGAVQMAYYLLAGLWLVNGIGYHLLFFSKINPPALVFGALFIVQAGIFAWQGWKNRAAQPEWSPGRTTTSLIIIFYALLFYSLIGYSVGHRYPEAPVFGVAPCPSTIFTFGMLLLLSVRLRWFVYGIPVLWMLVGTSAAFVLGVREDLGLAASALAFLVLQRRSNLI